MTQKIWGDRNTPTYFVAITLKGARNKQDVKDWLKDVCDWLPTHNLVVYRLPKKYAYNVILKPIKKGVK